MLRVLHHTNIDSRMRQHLHLRCMVDSKHFQNEKYRQKNQLSSLVSATIEQSSNSVIMKMFNMIRSFRNRGDRQSRILSNVLSGNSYVADKLI